MLFLTLIGVAGGSFLFGRWHGYETSEKHYKESKDFWEELKKHGL